ncbi:MAG: hypothetical protein EB059_11270, partial [Alphaproteobacteria bacterium]|nr:hypothetical protein [Alphaproteobacteria bacterium]
MRIFLLCNDDLTTHTIFSHVLKSQQFTVAGIAFTTSYTSKDKGILGALRLLKKMSWRYWVFLVASNGAFKLHEKMLLLFGRAYPPSGLFNMRLWAKENNIPVYSSDNFNHPQFIKIVQSAKPDLILLRINQILHAEILNTPVYGCWCIHSSLLPAYKGIAGEFHALRNAEKIIGSTIFNVEEKLDEGARLYQTSFAVEPQNSLLHHIYKNNHLAGALLFN